MARPRRRPSAPRSRSTLFETARQRRAPTPLGETVPAHHGRCAIMGPSGSGKSTLPLPRRAGHGRSGGVLIGDTDITRLKDKQLTGLRRSAIGFVFQSFNLLPTLTAAENIELPLRIAGRRLDRDWLDGIVRALGLGDRLRHRPSELWRAAATGRHRPRPGHRPVVVFADEPTGNLDSRAGQELLGLLRHSVTELGQRSDGDPRPGRGVPRRRGAVPRRRAPSPASSRSRRSARSSTGSAGWKRSATRCCAPPSAGCFPTGVGLDRDRPRHRARRRLRHRHAGLHRLRTALADRRKQAELRWRRRRRSPPPTDGRRRAARRLARHPGVAVADAPRLADQAASSTCSDGRPMPWTAGRMLASPSHRPLSLET